ncbi:MAG: tetratricopeptide repeat protein [Gammaproteobacteria bacterium]|nr:tetratricopeptide repeat protein [Gammaproteobacteria bacterium]MBT3859086.1 tetratricopeptide repeat protein [Gammaproteobacteria bacterium]MBT3987086.1 tetratricopeptide repeat protein [Gammaproteobacteria bacterium]MBT4255227.1 tetratricopeptide repeat protein [Gammaproteobacteria bacterium]MBT4580649.1 tetratricopeptide repeat protein [Gammaproteobacteria bacterium]
MAINAAEEESLEALKKWWEENGKQLLTMVIVVFALGTSWLLWQNSQIAAADAASDIYEEILTLAVAEPGTEVSAENGAQILDLGNQLRADHSGTVYALFGSLFSAQQQVRTDDLAAAEESLQWILDNQKDGMFDKTDEGLILTASLRLGRVILAQGDAERALSLINNLDPKTFEPGFAELRGDVYLAMGRLVDAREAYQAAQQAGSNSGGLRMKLDDLSAES